MGYIDAHVHVWTDDCERYPVADGFRPEDAQPRFTPDELLPLCEASGVDRVVLVQMSFYGYDNSYMLDAIAERPDVFRGVAIVDPAMAGLGEELARLRAAGVRGLRIYSLESELRSPLSADQNRRLMHEAGRAGIAICPLLDPDFLPGVYRAAERTPHTTFGVDHLARIGITGSIDDTEVDYLCALAKLPNVFVKVSAFYALGAKQPPYLDLVPLVRRAYDAFGPERLMWATDSPFQAWSHGYGESITLVRDGLDFLSDSDREWLLRRTAERVFFGE